MLARWSAVWACLLCLGCASAELEQTTQDIDGLVARLETAPQVSPGQRVGPKDLLHNARRSGPNFIAAEVETARARLALDAQKSGLRPRVSLGARQRVSAIGSGTSETDLFVGLDWNAAQALMMFGDGGLDIVQALIPVQTNLAQNSATQELFQAYADYGNAMLAKREATVRRTAAMCRRNAMEAELSLGNISAREVAQVDDTIQSLGRLLAASQDAVQTARRQTAFLAGLSEDAKFGAYQTPKDLFPPVSAGISRERCYLQSGNAARDGLLLSGATLGIRAAKLERFGTFELGVPSQFSAGAGLSVDILISILTPLIDQGDGRRRVQEARLAVLDILLSGEQNRRRFDLSLSEIRENRANAATDASLALEQIHLAKADGALSECAKVEAVALAQIALERARIARDFETTRLALLCAPAPVVSVRNPDARNAAFDALAPAEG